MAVKAAVIAMLAAVASGLVLVAVGFWQAWYPLGFIVGGAELVAAAWFVQDQLGGYLAARRK